ncbi:MAG: glycosyltransferase family 2 protein [Lachnospiraceae bacterium]
MLPLPFYKIKKAFLYLKHFGPKEFFNHLVERLEPEEIPYKEWYKNHFPDEKTLEKLRAGNKADDPKISIIIPAYETPDLFLRQLVESVKAQTYDNWELCIGDASDKTDNVKRTVGEYAKEDNRIVYAHLEKNAGIAQNTNEAMKLASGDYFAFMDHDDLIAPHALSLMAAKMREGADVVYTDEDKVSPDLKKHFQPNFKPDFNIDLLRSNNYITHFLAVSRKLADLAGGFDPEFNGSQDYDFIFRCCEKAVLIAHVPEILYHWRTHESSTADNPMSKLYAYDAGKRAIEGNLRRSGIKGEVSLLKDFGFYRVKYSVTGNPLVSIIIPNKDCREELEKCINAVLASSYKNIEILIVENNSTDSSIFEYYTEISQNEKISVLEYKGSFNYSAINNFAASKAGGEYLILLNNDVRPVINPEWIEELLGICQREDVGITGAKLYYPNDRIQHAGCVIGMGNCRGGGVAGAMFVDMPRSHSGYLHKASLIQDMSAVTAACMMVRKSVFERAGGFTEELAVAFNDMDLCLKVREMGYLVVYNPYAEAYHDESRSRGAEDTEEKRRRFQEEMEYMRTRWQDILKNGDPYYNKNLSLKKWNYSLRP